MGRDGRFRVKTMRGEPFHVGDRTLIPEAKVISFGRAQGTVGSDQISGWGIGFANITPVALVEETNEGERRTPIADATANAVWSMIAGALAMTLFFGALRWLIRRRRGA